MEASELIRSNFWTERRARVLAPPSLEEEGARLERELRGDEGVVFATSGASGRPKWVFMRRAALLSSAEAVNKHLSVSPRDRLLLPLPLYHVGGFGMAARAFVGGCDLRALPGRWDGLRFVEALREHGSTLTSLVPTQVHDLVVQNLEAPRSLRAVIVGGASLDELKGQAARELGWPLLQSYGMTEAASQVATAHLERAKGPFRAAPLPIMDQWECRLCPEGRLELRGDALFDFYLRWDGSVFCREKDRDAEGWFRSGDAAELKGRSLTLRGRADRRVKVLGELVDLQVLEDELRAQLGGLEVYLLPIPDGRRGWLLQPVVEGSASEGGKVDDLIELINERVPGFSRMERACFMDQLPRTALGKVDGATTRIILLSR